MKYLQIKSKNEIPVEALSLVGASTKRGDNKSIGMFGSGAKYSLAAMLRNNINFKIFSGEEEILISTEEVSLKDKFFKRILINKQSTSLTTDMGGKDWDDSFSYIREIYSNALDEDDETILNVVSEITKEAGFTSYYIEFNEDVRKFYNNKGQFFCMHREDVLSSNDYASIYPPSNNGVRLFRRGILCYNNTEIKSVYDYNSNDFEINESRVLKGMWSAKQYIARSLKVCGDYNIINNLISKMKGGNSGYFEHELYWQTYEPFSQTWFDVLKDLKLVGAEYVMFLEATDLEGATVLPSELLTLLKAQFPDLWIVGMEEKTTQKLILEKNPSQVLIDKVLDCLIFLNTTNYKHRINDPNIKYVKFTKSNVLGLAENNSIYLSTKLSSYSNSDICKIIIEENEHLITELGDETRAFQNHLFNLYYEELIKTK